MRGAPEGQNHNRKTINHRTQAPEGQNHNR